MTIPQPLAAIPRHLNPIVQPVARRLPPLAVLHHRGQRSGRLYHTPVQAYPAHGGGWLVGLVYDHNAPWALNLLAADGGEMTRAGRRYQVTDPRRVGREARDLLNAGPRLLMRVVGIDEYLLFDAAPPTDPH